MGMLLAFGEGENLGSGTRFNNAVAGEYDGLLGLLDQRGRWTAGLPGVPARASGAGGTLVGGGIEVKCCGGLLCVLGDVHQHGPWTAAARNLKGFTHGRSDVFRTRDEEVVLRDRQGDAGDVDFLEGVAAEHLGGDLAGDGDHGDAVQHGGGEAGDEVGGAGAEVAMQTPTRPLARA